MNKAKVVPLNKVVFLQKGIRLILNLLEGLR